MNHTAADTQPWHACGNRAQPITTIITLNINALEDKMSPLDAFGT
jgi:hypothetical protein